MFLARDGGEDRLLYSHLYRLRVQNSRHIRRVHLGEEAPVPGVYEYAWQVQDALLHVNRHGPAYAEGRGSPHHVPRMFLSHGRIAGSDRFRSDGPGQVLCRYLPVAVHEDDERVFMLVLHDERFDGFVLVASQFAGGHGRSSPLFVFIRAEGKDDAVLFEGADGRS